MIIDRLTEVIEPEVSALGFILWGVELDAHGADTGGLTLRVLIDYEEGISIEDCQKTSRAVSAVLDVEDLVSQAYALEVSSPGVNRRIFNEHQVKALVGFDVKVQLQHPDENGRRRLKGTICGVENGVVTIKMEEDSLVEFDFINVDKMRVIPNF